MSLLFEDNLHEEEQPRTSDVVYTKDNLHPQLNERFSKKYLQVITTKTFYDYLHDLEDNKKTWKGRIGNGYSSVVAALKNSENVIKVVNVDSVRTEYDKGFLDPYLRYLHEASSYPKNPLFPKINSVKMFVPTSPNARPFAVIEMEKLNRYNSRIRRVAKYTYDAIRLSLKSGDNIEAVKATAKAIWFGTEAGHIVEMVETLQRIFEIDLPYYSDLHPDNVMVRGRDQLVITDPFMYEEDSC